MTKEILSLAIMLPMLVLADQPKNITSKLAVQPKDVAMDQLLINQEALTDASKGIAIYVGDNGMIQVYNKAISDRGQFYDPGDKPTGGMNNSIFLTFQDSGGRVTQFGEYSFGTDFTNNLQTMSGSGTSAAPFQVTTTFEANDNTLGIKAYIKITDRYVVPHQYFDREIELTNLPQGYDETRVFWYFDTALNSSATNEGYCYEAGDTMGVYDDGVSLSMGAGTAWTQYALNDYSNTFAQIRDDNQLVNSVCSGRDDVRIAAQWDVTGTSSYKIKTRMSFTTQTVMATYSPDAVEVGDTSTLTLSVGSDTEGAILGGSFDYTLPSSITLASPTPSGNTCPVTSLVSATGDTITASSINLAAGGSCTISYQVKGMVEDSAQSGSFTTSSLDPLVGTIRVISAASGSTIAIPSNHWLGLLVLILASIGFGRYYFKNNR